MRISSLLTAAGGLCALGFVSTASAQITKHTDAASFNAALSCAPTVNEFNDAPSDSSSCGNANNCIPHFLPLAGTGATLRGRGCTETVSLSGGDRGVFLSRDSVIALAGNQAALLDIRFSGNAAVSAIATDSNGHTQRVDTSAISGGTQYVGFASPAGLERIEIVAPSSTFVLVEAHVGQTFVSAPRSYVGPSILNTFNVDSRAVSIENFLSYPGNGSSCEQGCMPDPLPTGELAFAAESMDCVVSGSLGGDIAVGFDGAGIIEVPAGNEGVLLSVFGIGSAAFEVTAVDGAGNTLSHAGTGGSQPTLVGFSSPSGIDRIEVSDRGFFLLNRVSYGCGQLPVASDISVFDNRVDFENNLTCTPERNTMVDIPRDSSSCGAPSGGACIPHFLPIASTGATLRGDGCTNVTSIPGGRGVFLSRNAVLDIDGNQSVLLDIQVSGNAAVSLVATDGDGNTQRIDANAISGGTQYLGFASPAGIERIDVVAPSSTFVVAEVHVGQSFVSAPRTYVGPSILNTFNVDSRAVSVESFSGYPGSASSCDDGCLPDPLSSEGTQFGAAPGDCVVTASLGGDPAAGFEGAGIITPPAGSTGVAVSVFGIGSAPFTLIAVSGSGARQRFDGNAGSTPVVVGFTSPSDIVEIEVIDNGFFLINEISHCTGAVDAIELSRFSATRNESGVTLAWQTATELDCAGFDLLRCEGAGCDVEAAEVRTQTPIACAGSLRGADYRWLDATAPAGVDLVYFLREHQGSGGFADYGPLRLAAGASSAQFSDSGSDISGSRLDTPRRARGGCASTSSAAGLSALAWALMAAVLRRRRRG